MEDNKDLELDNQIEGTEDTGAEDNSETENQNTDNDNNTTEEVSMSKADYDKAIQSAEDKVRGKLSKRIKELEAKVKELSPIEKTQAEIDLEERIARLEESEKAVQEQKRKLDFQEKLNSKGIDKELFDYLKDDVDIDALATVLEAMAKSKVKGNGYVPADHSSDDTVSFEEYNSMSYSQKEEFMRTHPETFKRFQSMKKR